MDFRMKITLTLPEEMIKTMGITEDTLFITSYENGQIRSCYVDAADGLCKTAVNDLVGYSQKLSCAEIALQLMPAFVADSFDTKLLEQDALQYIYFEDYTLHTNDKALNVTQLYQQEDILYKQN